MDKCPIIYTVLHKIVFCVNRKAGQRSGNAFYYLGQNMLALLHQLFGKLKMQTNGFLLIYYAQLVEGGVSP